MSTAPLHRLGLALLMVLTLLGQPSGLNVPPPPPADVPAVTMQGGSPEEEELLAWAISRYEQAGLGLPPIVVRFHADGAVCGELDGFIGWDGEIFVIDTCRTAGLALQHNLLHEMAHAWDLADGPTEARRRGFMDLRGVADWHELADDWPQRGAEQAAEILAWGLKANPTTIPTRVGDVGPQDEASLTQAFQALTGRLPLWSA